MSKILNKRIFATLLATAVTFSTIPVKIVASENQFTVGASKLAEDSSFEMILTQEVEGAARIGDEVYSTIAEAIAAAHEGDTIVISRGTYAEPIVLGNKSITLEGTGSHETILTGGITFKNESYEGSNITIRNLNFKQNGIYFNVNEDLSKMEALKIEDNIFKNAPSYARVYTVCIENTSNPINGLVIRNNEFVFEDTEVYKEGVLGGINATVYGDAEITGNTFKNMPYNGILLYGVGNGSEHTINLSGNTFDEWGFNTKGYGGRAIRISGVGEAGEVDMTNNKFVCENMPEEYIKITGNVGRIDMSKCYWNGDDATVEGFVWNGSENTSENGKVICDGNIVLENYFVADTMRDPQDLNIYEVPEEKPVFTDTVNHWAAEEIHFVVERGLFNGTGASTFSPNAQMTRGTFAVVLGRLVGVDVSGYMQSSFSDVKADAYYMGYIEWASENKLVNGIGNGKFAPDQGISREQVAVILENYAKAFGFDFPTTNKEIHFSDSSKISAWAKEAVKKVQMAGIMGSRANNNFDPQGIATRAEAATVIKRFIESVIERN